MKITLLSIGKTVDKYVVEGVDKYVQRLKHYLTFQTLELPELKNTKSFSQKQQKVKEALIILKHVNSTDYVILLDEKGKELSSVDFSVVLNKKMISGMQHIIFVIGGPYGFDSSIYSRADDKISLSKMTFSHQMVRLFFVEQLYRACTILKGEPYHHQ